MNINLLIDAIVRQTTVLIAQLATTAGARAQLAHTANQVFMDLVAELRDQGLGHKVIADMFGLSLRTYHNQVKRLSEARSERGRSLWAAILAYLQQRPVTRRGEVLMRFSRDDEATVKGVLRDLTDSGIISVSGKGDAVSYRVVDADEQLGDPAGDPHEALANLLWVAVHRFGPVTAAELVAHVPAEHDALEAALQQLVGEGKVRASETAPGEAGAVTYSCDDCVIEVGAAAGWEAAVFDHYQAMVTALSAKLRNRQIRARPDDRIGGSTYVYDIWKGHPMYDEVVGFLAVQRGRAVELRKRLESYNRACEAPRAGRTRVIHYLGQTVLDNITDDDYEEDDLEETR